MKSRWRCHAITWNGTRCKHAGSKWPRVPVRLCGQHRHVPPSKRLTIAQGLTNYQ